MPFVSCSGSEFVEMFVGVGASRVRDLFAKAKKNAPCIVFIDEIDAVGRARPGGTGGGPGGGNDEREQTLNQILTEMDGFEGNSGVIVISATNRGDILDPALLRPGRFDRRVPVDLPDKPGREQILKVHARGKPLDADVTLGEIAARTTGFSGASLENLLNEAAIMAARRNRTSISYSEVDYAIDRIQVGLVKTGGGQSFPARQRLVAYHEAGHAVMGLLTPDYDTVTKVTIIPRSNGAGGFTLFTPSDEQLESGLYSKRYLEGQLAVALGGRGRGDRVRRGRGDDGRVERPAAGAQHRAADGGAVGLHRRRRGHRRHARGLGGARRRPLHRADGVGRDGGAHRFGGAPHLRQGVRELLRDAREAPRADGRAHRPADRQGDGERRPSQPRPPPTARPASGNDLTPLHARPSAQINARELLEMLEKYDPKLFKELGKEAPPDLVPVPAA